jgi:ribosomal protein S18 acetylase RimI-like enzyme
VSAALRPPREEDLQEVARRMSLHWPEPVDEGTVRQGWTAPGVDVERDARLDAAGYAMVEDLGAGRAWIDLRGSPSPALMDWAEAHAGEAGTRLFAGAWSSNEAVLRQLAQRGFAPVRHSLRMEIDLTEATADPAWPDGVEVRTFREGDERTFYDVHRETFEDSWEPMEETFEEWTHWLLRPPAFVPELWFLALAGGEPAGIAVCHPHAAVEGLGWVRLLGVRRPWRRRGLGRALLLHAFHELRRRGLSGAGLGVDASSDTGANRLYESAGMRVAGRFEIYEKEVG